MMFFQPAQYLEFAKGLDVSEADCILAFSGLTCPYTMAELGLDGRVLEKNKFYPYGNEELKEEIARRYGVKPDQVLIPGGGTSLSNFLVAAALLGPGDRAVMETPTYEPLRSTVASSGAEVIPLARPFGVDCRIDLREFAALLRSPVKLAAITRLHNPSGQDVGEADLVRMGEMADEVGAYVLVDEVYLDFLPPGSAKIGATLHPRLISTSSVTKVYGLGDLRLGWAIGPPDLIQHCWRINNVLGAVPPTIPEQVALELLRNGGLDRIGRWARQRAAENLTILEQALRNHPRLDWVKPDGGIMAFMRLKNGGDASQFVTHLREKHRTLVMPGRFFDQPDGFRLGFGVPAEEVVEGLRRIELALEELSD